MHENDRTGVLNDIGRFRKRLSVGFFKKLGHVCPSQMSHCHIDPTFLLISMRLKAINMAQHVNTIDMLGPWPTPFGRDATQNEVGG